MMLFVITIITKFISIVLPYYALDDVVFVLAFTNYCFDAFEFDVQSIVL